MKSQTTGERPGRFRGAGRLLVCLALLGGLVAVAVPGAFHPGGAGAIPQGDANRPEGVFLRLDGPNDGEPINSRVSLGLWTNATEGGFLTVCANSILLYSRPFRSGLRHDEATGLHVTEIDVDLDLLHRLFPARFLDPDAAPFTITASLYSADGAHMITYDDWIGYLGKPWIDVVKLDAGRAGGNVAIDGGGPLGTVRVIVHPLAKDTYYFLLASPDRDLLTLSPEDPPLLRHARKLQAGSCGDGQNPAGDVIYLDRVTDLPWSPSHAVLWTFDFYGGWKRSAILTLP